MTTTDQTLEQPTADPARPPRPAQSAAAARVGGGVGHVFHDLSGNTVSPVEWLREYADMAAPSNGGDSEDARGLRVIADMLACLRATVTEPQGGDDSGYAEQYDRGHRAACADVLAILDSTQATPTPAVADALARAEAAEAWPCDECGARVEPSDIAERGAVRQMVEPDSAHGGEKYETLCETCAALAALPARPSTPAAEGET